MAKSAANFPEHSFMWTNSCSNIYSFFRLLALFELHKERCFVDKLNSELCSTKMVYKTVTTDVIQARVPSRLIEELDSLVEAGYYKNRSEAIVDALRHFIGTQESQSEIGKTIRLHLRGHQKPLESVQLEELEAIAKKLTWNSELRARFGTSLEETMRALRGRS
ncbi:MAG: ribbon-helix-helix protein, CopG family [Candidatus Hodarchaeales archaeon]